MTPPVVKQVTIGLVKQPKMVGAYVSASKRGSNAIVNRGGRREGRVRQGVQGAKLHYRSAGRHKADQNQQLQGGQKVAAADGDQSA